MLATADTGKEIRELPRSAMMEPFGGSGMTWMENGKKTEALDRDGRVLFVLPSGDKAGGPFRHGLSPVRRKKGWGLMDQQGQWVVPPVYKDLKMM